MSAARVDGGVKPAPCLPPLHRSALSSMATELYLPPNLPYPITVTSIDCRSPSQVTRGTRLLSYSFLHQPDLAQPPETRFGTWDATVEGTVDLWKLKVGEVVPAQRARDRPVVYITEPCKHGVQIGGLCGLCGKDMTKCVQHAFPSLGNSFSFVVA
jgi:RNA polymerase II subunit A C-terminal domain phosphatase